MITTYDLRDSLTLVLSSKAIYHFVLSIKGGCYPILQLQESEEVTLGM